ncbi:MAG: DUF4190 domain-containing protein [Micrococcales bacterium]
MSSIENTVFCGSCATRVAPAMFCSNCGSVLVTTEPVKAKPAAKSKAAAKPADQAPVDEPISVVQVERPAPAAAQVQSSYVMNPPGNKYNVFAIVSFALAMVGFGPIASIFGHISLSQIKKTGEEGRGLAIAGIVIGYAAVALGILGIAVLVALFNASSNYGYY